MEIGQVDQKSQIYQKKINLQIKSIVILIALVTLFRVKLLECKDACFNLSLVIRENVWKLGRIPSFCEMLYFQNYLRQLVKNFMQQF